VERALSNELAFVAEWKALERGTPAERACFSAFGIRHGDVWLTEAEDWFAHSLTEKVYLSAFPLAEWLAWNWWRLRWEPRTRAADWPVAHRLSTIGRGYVWPNVTIVSDGERVALIAEPTAKRPEEPLRYLARHTAIVTARAFEMALDQFMTQIGARLSLMGITESNFEKIWSEVVAERSDPELAQRRKFEALLGADPDESDPEMIERLVADAQALGTDPMSEIAADRPRTRSLLTAADLRGIAGSSGFAGSSDDRVRFAPQTPLPTCTEVPAWRLGATAARSLREQQHLGAVPISDVKLAELAGVAGQVLAATPQGGQMSFVLSETNGATQTVLRSKWHESRRFELARLICDHLINPVDTLLPATRSATYRQKVQRSFAAEFLAPFDEVIARLDGEYDSYDSRKEVADHFEVSELTIRTALLNHHRLGQADLNADFDLAMA
jgi:hypothetical protein